MTVKCTSRYATHPADYARYDMQQLKDHYLVNGLFRDDEINFVYTHYDRLMVGGAKPVDDRGRTAPRHRFLDQRGQAVLRGHPVSDLTIDHGVLTRQLDLNF